MTSDCHYNFGKRGPSQVLVRPPQVLRISPIGYFMKRMHTSINAFRVIAILFTVALVPLPIYSGKTKAILRVGIKEGDLRGNDDRVIRTAIDKMAKLGGGTVQVLPGRYQLRNAVIMRSGVRLIGTHGKTVFVLSPGRKTTLAADVAKGDTKITLTDPTGFEVGMGIFLQDSSGHGFQVTTAMLGQKVRPNSFRLSQPAVQEYLQSRSAEVKLGFSGIHCHSIHDALIDGITIEGNHGQPGSQYLGGCRGGGIYLANCSNVVVRNCTVRRYNGDAISFQKNCRNITVEHCLTEKNANVGIHQGSYSQECVVRNNTIRNNGYVGLFVCVGVRKTLFQDNLIQGNAGCGISIGFDDSDNIFRGNRVLVNAETGVLFRRDSLDPKHGAHRNVFEKNIIRDNLGPRPERSNSRPESAGKAAVVIEGVHHGLVFRDNEFSFSKKHSGSAFLCDDTSDDIKLSNNRLMNVERNKINIKTKNKK